MKMDGQIIWDRLFVMLSSNQVKKRTNSVSSPGLTAFRLINTGMRFACPFLHIVIMSVPNACLTRMTGDMTILRLIAEGGITLEYKCI